MNILGSHSPLHHSSLSSGKCKTGKKTCNCSLTLHILSVFIMLFYKNVLLKKKNAILCSHPHSSALVPWQDNQRRVPPHYPPAGTSRWVSKLAKLFSLYIFTLIYLYTCVYIHIESVTLSEGFYNISSPFLLHRLFLLRVSQSNPKAFVLTLCHHQKIKHFQILPVRLSHTCYMSRACLYIVAPDGFTLLHLSACQIY